MGKSIRHKRKTFMKPLYKLIFSYLEENKLKIFRWKLIQYIIPTIFFISMENCE